MKYFVYCCENELLFNAFIHPGAIEVVCCRTNIKCTNIDKANSDKDGERKKIVYV